jgi:hypothetical protein
LGGGRLKNSSSSSRDHPIDQRIRGANIESDHLIRSVPSRQPGDVRDATQIERESIFVGIRERGEMEKRRQGRAFAPRRNIPRAKISNRGAPGPLRDQRGVPDLECGSEFGVVGDRLTVRRDRIDFGEREADTAGERNRRLREALREQHVEGRQFTQHASRRQAPRGEFVDARLKRLGKGILAKGDQLERPRSLSLRPFDESGVHSIRGSSRHQPDHTHSASLPRSKPAI